MNTPLVNNLGQLYAFDENKLMISRFIYDL